MTYAFDDFIPNRPLPEKATTGRKIGRQLQRQPDGGRALSGPALAGPAPESVHQALESPGQALDPPTQVEMSERFGHDFSRVRVHSDDQAARSARSVSAQAYTVGQQVVFGAGRYAPGTSAGRSLLAHELAHVVQQSESIGAMTGAGRSTIANDGEAEAEQAAHAVVNKFGAPIIASAVGPSIQRKVEMRDVGRGEQSGIARLPELIDRLNAMSSGLTYSMNGRELNYAIREGGTPSFFDRQMMAFIDQEAVIPLRLTNRHGLLGDRVSGFHDQVDVDAWTSGYVDIDDLLASSDLGLQSVFVHFLRERTATSRYAQRIGTDTFTDAEFQRVHGLGIQAEEELLRDFFSDPSIRIVNDSPSPTIRRVFRNSRGDLIRRRVTPGRGEERGVNAMSIDVRLRDGRVLTAEEYRRLLEEERIASQVRRERLMGATEYREGGRSVPAP
jgi:hypothetical protein